MVIITATYFLQFFLKDGTLEWYDLLALVGNQKYGGICLPMTIADSMGTEIWFDSVTPTLDIDSGICDPKYVISEDGKREVEMEFEVIYKFCCDTD